MGRKENMGIYPNSMFRLKHMQAKTYSERSQRMYEQVPPSIAMPKSIGIHATVLTCLAS